MPFNKRELLQETLGVLSNMDVLGMIPNKVLHQWLITFRRVSNSSNRMLNIITCSTAGMDWITLVERYSHQEKRMEGLNQQVMTSMKSNA